MSLPSTSSTPYISISKCSSYRLYLYPFHRDEEKAYLTKAFNVKDIDVHPNFNNEMTHYVERRPPTVATTTADQVIVQEPELFESDDVELDIDAGSWDTKSLSAEEFEGMRTAESTEVESEGERNLSDSDEDQENDEKDSSKTRLETKKANAKQAAKFKITERQRVYVLGEKAGIKLTRQDAKFIVKKR